MSEQAKPKRVLTGYRPTGKLHLGHWFGNLMSMLEFQHEDYEPFFFVADWHALTSNWQNTQNIPQFTEDMVMDWLAAGLDPKKTVIYRQSDIPEVAELSLYMSMVTPMSWLERVPTYKEQKQNITDKDLSNVGFFLYPNLMSADIAIMRADAIPVGKDQEAHLEINREIVRRFNGTYGEGILVEPHEVYAKDGQKVPGIDGRKMSKSYDNSIYLSDTIEDMKKKAMQFMTDPARKLKTDPGEPNICPLHQVHKLVAQSPEDIAKWEECCRAGSCGCVAHKKAFAEDIAAYFEPFHERRQEIEKDSDYVRDVLIDGAKRAKPIAEKVISDCREAMHLNYTGK